MDETLEQRLTAVERALTDGERPLSDLPDAEETAARLDALAADIEELTDRVAELEAASQALRGYVGNVRAVNEDVEQRADLALEKAEAALAGEPTETHPTDAPTESTAAQFGQRRERTRDHDASTAPRSTAKADTVTDSPQTEAACDRSPLRGTRDAEPRPDPTALADDARERAPDGGTVDSDEESTSVGVLARIRDFV